MLAVDQIGSRTLRSECITARIVLGAPWGLSWARSGDATREGEIAVAARLRHFIRSALPARCRAFTGGNHGFRGDLDLGHVIVALGREPQRVVAELDRRILGRTFRRLAGR